ncbi:MAG TPA: ABC transporter substrate-binding protein [Xanthobacteraceae bacterium]|nr:ABC transporter substrate-binding protein [Xanthobacteraceae bacterium]
MDRRKFLKTAVAAAIAASPRLAAPALAQGAVRTLRFAPHADLANFDPIWGTANIVRNAGALVYDMLYGFDVELQPQRQMIEAEEVSADRLTWTFRLRPGLKFHDGEPVLARDAVASLNRWCARDNAGRLIKAIENELVAVDDRTFRWVLKKPYPKLPTALGKVGAPLCVIMPERLAKTDPFKQVSEHIGSGPMRFVAGERISGARVVFEKFADYLPRAEPASWLAGGKKMLIERIEWITMPDPGASAAALQNGEIDWWEQPLADLAPLLRRNRNVMVEIADPLGNVGTFRMNHLHPPFNDVRARRAILTAMSQEDYMRAVVGDDTKLWKPMPSFIPPDTLLYNEEGGDILKGPRRLDAAKRLLAESGYAGQPVTCMAAQDQPSHKAMGDITVDLLGRLGVNVDFVATDWGTVVGRRAQKSPPGQGGWQMFHTVHPGVDCVDPLSYQALRANGDAAWFGWPSDAPLEAAIAAWMDAEGLEAEKAAARRVNRAAFDCAIFGPTGFFLRYTAWRKNIAGIVQAPIPFFWGVSKNA